jgi:Ca2+-binding EF-hand superfamily protein
MHKIALLLCGALALGASAAGADPKYDARAAFAQADQNKDGVIDHQELVARATDVFFLGDVDKDGFLTSAEMTRVVVFEGDFAAADKNHDSKVSLPEFAHDRIVIFEAADSNGDGVLSVVEVSGAYDRGPGAKQ